MIEHVVISEIEELTEIDISKVPSDFVLGAINVNHDEHAYCKVRFDSKSVDWLTQNLHFTDALTRAATWRNFWILLMDKKITSLQFLEFIKKQIVLESVQQIIEVGLMNLGALINNFIPLEEST